MKHPDLGETDATGLTSIEREFVGTRLMTATIHADSADPLLSLWPARYLQDVPRLLREISRLRALLNPAAEVSTPP